jgi:NAD(P)-dependent dehydrogenase (short-subunit alcohol dehydrogenase family)
VTPQPAQPDDPAFAQYPSSKAAPNMLTAMYAKKLPDTPIGVNAANPGKAHLYAAETRQDP